MRTWDIILKYYQESILTADCYKVSCVIILLPRPILGISVFHMTHACEITEFQNVCSMLTSENIYSSTTYLKLQKESIVDNNPPSMVFCLFVYLFPSLLLHLVVTSHQLQLFLAVIWDKINWIYKCMRLYSQKGVFYSYWSLSIETKSWIWRTELEEGCIRSRIRRLNIKSYEIYLFYEVLLKMRLSL